MLIIISSLCILNGCVVYTEKQSEALSRTVVATKDSLDNARVDLADEYIQQAARIVKPPKNRIQINPVYKKNTPPKEGVYNPEKNTSHENQRIILVPEKYKNDSIVVVNSEEYQKLLSDKKIFEQLKKDTKNLKDTKELVEKELTLQLEYRDKMIRDLNALQTKVVKKDLLILRLYLVIAFLVSILCGGVYLRMKGIL